VWTAIVELGPRLRQSEAVPNRRLKNPLGRRAGERRCSLAHPMRTRDNVHLCFLRNASWLANRVRLARLAGALPLPSLGRLAC
jgi:hypothetical protein